VTLDAAGQRTNLADSRGTTSFGYDQAGQLISASYPDGTGETDTYDRADELTSSVSKVGAVRRRPPPTPTMATGTKWGAAGRPG
jgi:YD repeat-containing protein